MRTLTSSILAAVACIGLSGLAAAQQTNNDDCSGAIPISDGLTTGSTAGFTTSSTTGSCGLMGSEVWYSYVAPGPGTLTASFCAPGTSAGYDPCLAIFTGTCGNLTQVACNDDTCALLSELVIPVTAGTTYYIAVGGYNGDSGSFTISVRCTNCAVPATETVRLGTPPNPNAFRPGMTSAPIIGSVWDPFINHTNFVSDAMFDFMIVTTQPANGNFGPPSGVLLCDPFQPYLQVLTTAPGDPFQIWVPNMPSLVGVEVCTQGGSVDSSYQAIFANALDVQIGEV